VNIIAFNLCWEAEVFLCHHQIFKALSRLMFQSLSRYLQMTDLLRMKFKNIAFLLFFLFSSGIQAQRYANKETEKLDYLLYFLNNNYVDTVNSHLIVEEGIRAMLKELDPHSIYMTKDELKEMDEPLVGNFDGVGIQFNILEDTIVVVNTIVGGPSEKLGILAGDKIVKIEGDVMTGLKIKNKDVISRLRGARGTVVKVSIFRKGSKNLIDYSITRDKIPLTSIDATYMADPETGYIKLSRFSATSSNEFAESLDNLRAKGMKNLVLDLTGNGGGYLQTAIDIADQFLTNENLVVYTQGRTSASRAPYYSTSKGTFERGKLIVLIDEGSASASEIVSGAVQDLDRGLIIGRRSFGKGLVQNSFPFPDGSAMRMTTARYYTPAGRCIQKPYEKGVDDYYDDLNKRFKHGEFTNRDSITFADSLKFYTIGKRLVYGGGGIMPDIFIPLDTSENSKYLTDVYRKGLFNQFTLKYVDQNREQIKKQYPDFKAFKAGFVTTDALLNEFVAAAEAEEIKRNDADLITSGNFIRRQLRAIIANQIWGTNEFYECINEGNQILKEALNQMKSDNFKKLKLRY
jgi:carboxyl-terminal processing protease